MAGWDRRPRVENPVPWEHFGGTMDTYYEMATPKQLAAHFARAVVMRVGRIAPIAGRADFWDRYFSNHSTIAGTAMV